MSGHPPHVGPYRILGLLGSGGMGVVYRGVHTAGGAEAAVKVLRSRGNATQVARFRREARALQRLRHPNVTTILDVGSEGETLWIATERVEGESLGERLRRGPLPVERVRSIGVVLCDVLESAHALGLLHRDLKPDNVLIDAEGRPVLADFGLVKDLEIEESIRLSQTGRLMGTPGFWAPEQASTGKTSPATDVYGLGATLYALLTGSPPFVEASVLECVVATCDRPPEPPSKARPDTPAWLEEAVLACLAKAPGDRLRLEALRDRLQSGSQREAPPSRSRAMLVLMVAALLVLGAIVSWRATRRLEPAQVAPAPPTAPPTSPSASPVESAQATRDQGAEELRDGEAALEVRRFAEAARHFAASARLGNARGRTELARLHARGEEGVAKDEALAARLLIQSAEEGDPEAMLLLGYLYLNGRGVAKDAQRALRLYTEAARLGNSEAALRLGLLHVRGVSGAKDLDRGVGWLRQAAEAGEVRAMVQLAQVFYFERRDHEAAAGWYRQAANAKDVESMTTLGLLHFKGEGVARDPLQAAQWYRKAAALENPRAMRLLAGLRLRGEGVPRDVAEAVGLYRKAAQAGDVESMTALVSIYGKGQGVAQSDSEAERWAIRAAEAGHVESARQLGVLYGTGRGVAKNPAESVRWFRKAAEAGDAFAIAKLGSFHHLGWGGLPRDTAKALRLYRRAAKGGDPFAMAKISELYYEGEIVEKDFEQAAAWAKRAADAGHAVSMANLASLYERGEGVSPDVAQAAAWYRKSIKAGNAQAKQRLDALYEKHPELRQR